MDKTILLQVLQRYASTSLDEAKELAALRGQYPYSQFLHTLTARASKDHGLQQHQRDLQLAAVYAADRNNLKDIMTFEPEDAVQQIVSQHVDTNEQIVSTIDAADVADVVMDDLERLSKLKGAFENLFMDQPGTKQPVKVSSEEPAASPVAVPFAKPESSGKSKKERIIEMARALNTTVTTDDTATSKKKRRDKDGNPVDELIVQIQNSKEELAPESDLQKQQIEIINQFIRVQPSISNPRDRAPSAVGDLNTVKSGEFGDNIVSETLVEILLKQGKKDKAIEVLKKLIWKYPQKKAYFASQIEDLKK